MVVIVLSLWIVNGFVAFLMCSLSEKSKLTLIWKGYEKFHFFQENHLRNSSLYYIADFPILHVVLDFIPHTGTQSTGNNVRYWAPFIELTRLSNWPIIPLQDLFGYMLPNSLSDGSVYV